MFLSAATIRKSWARYTWILIICIVAFLIFLCVIDDLYSTRRTADDFTNFSRTSGISETVRLHGEVFTVINGDIIGHTSLSPRKRFTILRLAYSLAAAKHSPLLGLSGVEPESLRIATTQLEYAQRRLAYVQSTGTDRKAVGSALYPIAFLYALADLEQARQDFLLSGSDSDERVYRLALRRAVDAGVRDADRFARTLDDFLKNEAEFRLVGPARSVSKKDLASASTLLRLQYKALGNKFTTREHCMAGDVSLCEATRQQVLTRNGHTPKKSLSQYERLQVFDILAILREVNDDPNLRKGTVYVPLSSVCLSFQEEPRVFKIVDPGLIRIPIVSVGKLYFSRTGVGNVLEFLAREYGMRLSYLNVFEFYMCPDVLYDIGTGYALQETVRFAQEHPFLIPRERDKLLSDPVFRYEADALDYMVALAKYAAPDHKRVTDQEFREIVRLQSMWHEKSAGLDALVQTIADVSETNLELFDNDVLIDVGARNLFLTHSAFLSLFLMYNPTAGLDDQKGPQWDFSRKEAPHNPSLVTYPEVLEEVSRDTIIRDFRSYLDFENRDR